jgi:HlyD family secretion protein
MKRIFYYILLIIILGVLVISLWVYDRYFKEEKTPYLRFAVERGSLQETVKARGEVVVKKNFDLSFSISGLVERVFKREGEMVDKGDPLIKLDTKDLELQLEQLNALLKQRRLNLEKLVAGSTKENLAVLETKVDNAQKVVDDAELKLESIKLKADTDLQKIYDASLRDLGQAVSVARTALFTLTDIQYNHFLGAGIENDKLARHKADAVFALLGEKDAGWTKNEFLSSLKGGIFGEIQELLIRPEREAIDAALLKTLDALEKVKQALEAVPIKDTFSATEKTNLSSEKTNINTEIASISSNKQEIEAQKALNQTNIVSAQVELNDAKAALALARKNLILGQAGTRDEDIKIAKAQIEETTSQIKLIEEKIRKSYLYAPLGGQVAKIFIDNGEMATAGEKVVSLFSSGYKIQADISELDIGKLNPLVGNETIIYLDSFPQKKFSGKVVSIEPQEVVKDGDKFYRVNVYFENNEKEDVVRSGMSADLIIKTAFKDDVLKIPELAVYKKGAKKFVKVLVGESEKEVEIKTGISDGDKVEVVSGLEEGQVVVVSAD